MTEFATIDWFGGWGHLFSLKALLYFLVFLDESINQGSVPI